MPRRKNWKVAKARKAVLRDTVVKTGGCNLPDEGLANPLSSSVSDVRTSGALVSDLVIPDGGLAHPQKPSGADKHAIQAIPEIYLEHSLNKCNDTVTYSNDACNEKPIGIQTTSDINSQEKTSKQIADNETDHHKCLQIFGSIHQAHEMFSAESRGNQCSANALCSLVYAELSQLRTTHDIDNVLMDGDILYKEIVSGLKKRGAFRNMLLSFDELPNRFSVLNRNITVEKYDVISGLCVQHFDYDDLPSLEQALEMAFEKTQCILLIIGSVCSAIFKKGSTYFFFDSHSHGLDGLSNIDGRSILVSFLCMGDLVQFMYSHYDSMQIAITSQFDMLPIKFTIEKHVNIHKNEEKEKDLGQTDRLHKEYSPMLMEKYFLDQSRKLQCKRKYSENNHAGKVEKKKRRNEYMKNYMKLKRLDLQQKLKDRYMTSNSMRNVRLSHGRQKKERILSVKSKQKSRQDPAKREAEQTMTRKSMQKARQTDERRQKERIMSMKSKQTSRQDPEKQEAERARTRKSMQKARQTDERQQKERIMSMKSKQTSRQDPEKQEAERARNRKSMQKARQTDERREKERIMSMKSKQTSRQDPEKQEAERARTRKSMQKARQTDERRQKERIMSMKSKQTLRRDPEKQEAERAMTRKTMQKTRQTTVRRQKECIMSMKSKEKSRQDPEKQEAERAMTRKSMQKARQTAERRERERVISMKSKRKSRQCYKIQFKEKQRTLRSMHKKRLNILYQETERIKKEIKRKSKAYKDREKEKNTNMRRGKRAQKGVQEKETILRHTNRFGSNIENCIEKFTTAISQGPVFVCTCCHQTWFRHSVVLKDKVKHTIPSDMLDNLLTGYISIDNREWICNTCIAKMKQNKVPSLSVYNKNCFPTRPKELELHQLEERLVSLRIPFMQIRELPRGGQLSIKGNVVNVPVDIQPVIHSLPRTFDMHCTIPVKLKKKLSYKSCDFTENVRPLHVISALHWLVKNSDLYKEAGISIDDNWLQSITSDCSDSVKEFFGLDVNYSDKTDIDNDESDHFSEVDESENSIGNSDTLLDAADASTDNTYTFAPGEGQTPISLYQDNDAEYLSFPTIFCGQKRALNVERHVQIHYSDVCKLELRHIDRRVASNIPNIFFKLKKVQIKQVSDKVHLGLRRCKTAGRKFTASDMLNSRCLENMVRLDEGYYIFRSLRNSPPYFEARKKDVFAMIRQLGLPTWFMSLSSADTRWYDLLNILSQINNGCTLSREDIDAMAWVDKTKLVQKDPVTCVRYFDYRVQEFINTVLKSNHEPLGKIEDFFYRVEFQQRGSPHIHMLVWIENAPQYKTHSIEQVVSFIDRYVSCQADNEKQLVNLQVHKHSKSCRKREKAICRFGYPIPPMKATAILEPLDDTVSNKKQLKDLFIKIQKCLDEVKDSDLSFDDFLSLVGVTEEQYINALQSCLNSPKVFLKREVNESRINAYMKPILKAWGANHDLQFVLDPYACAVYIVSYISKAQRGMSILMNEACKEARRVNMDLRQQVRHIGNKFLNSVEVSAQEACYLLLQLPLAKSTRDVVFINTSTPAQRTFLLKSRENLEKLSPGSTEIEADNIIKRYSRRPKALENWCLADYVSQLDIKYGDSSTEPNDLNTQRSSLSESNPFQISATLDPQNEDAIPDCEVIDQNKHTNKLKKNLIPGGQTVLKNGLVIKERKHKKVIRYVRFSKKFDKENFFRERLLLFTPWRNEETDLKQETESYQSRYMSMKSFVENKASEYEKNSQQLDAALERIQDEENFDEVAPSNEQSEQDDASIGAADSESFIFFDPDRPESQRQIDIAVDVGANVAKVHIDVCRKTMPDLKYRELINSLNVKQREFFVHVLQTVKLNERRLNVFLSGGAGVGKSALVSALFEALQRYLTSDPGESPENCKVLLCAPTGKAAFHIKGITIHSAFRIPASQGYSCTPLSSDILNTLRTKYKELSVVMIDEVSMVGNNMLKLINERLQQIKGTTLPFGGLHMIFIGDLFQLKPVMDSWIFENLKKDFGPLAINLWQDLVVMHELDEIMRQRDDTQFAEILNRLREGKQTQNDIETLKTRNIDKHAANYPQKVVHLFNTNESVSNFNVKSYLNSNSEKVSMPALDHVIGDDSQAVKQQLISKLPNDPTHTAGLSSSVGIAIGMFYDLCLNLDVDDGLVNGSTCVVTKIEHKQNETTRPSIIWVSFSDDQIGSAWRYKYHNLYHQGINKSWTPIFDCKRSFMYFRKTFIRLQVPLRQSTAKTVHKSQGDTLNEVVIDMSGKRVFSHAHYVAVSRSKTLQGLHILNLNESKITVSEKVIEEMLRLRKNRLQLCYTPVYTIANSNLTCMFHNIRSLNNHKDELFKDPNVQAADILCLVETWLTSTDNLESVKRTGYHVVRADGLEAGHTRPHRGILVYVSDIISVLDSYSVTRKDIEMVVLSILFHEKQILIVSLYRSPTLSANELKSFLTENLYEQNQGKQIILQGDFNLNVLEKSSGIASFIKDKFGCKQLIQKPTHSTGSLIDHIYSNIESVSTDVIECVWSDHAMIYAAIPKSD